MLAALEDADFWSDLHPDRLAFLHTAITPLFRSVWEADFKAMRFECDLLEYALAVWNGDQQQAETLQKGIVQQISALPLSIRFVEQEAPLIRAAQSPHYWAKADEDTLEELLTQLGPLMQFGADDTEQEPIPLDGVDGLYTQEGVASGPRHAAVRAAFAPFLRTHTMLNSRQRAFLALLQDFLIQRETVEKKDLIQAPFTVIHPQGIRGVFNPDEINEILPLTERLAA